MATTQYNTTIDKVGTDGTDFDNNYKSKCKFVTNQIIDSNYICDCSYSDFKVLIDGESYKWSDVRYVSWDDTYTLYLVKGFKQVMASSRPSGTTVVFATAGDKITTPQEIHGGVKMIWDFSNTDDDVTSPPTGFKQKQFDLQFIDKVWLKEGSVYYHNTPKGSYISFEVVCPDGQYYYKNDGTPTLATADTVVHKYVARHYLQGDVPMGDELNTEAATLDPLPTNYYMRITVTTPDTDSTSNGFAEIEMYRTRTVILE